MKSNVTEDQKKATDFFNRYKEDQDALSAQRKEFKRVTENTFNDDFEGFDFKLGEKKFRYGVKNPNDVGGKLSTDEIKVIVNGTELAQVSSEEFKVPARDEFFIPLKVVIPTKRIFENNKNGVLGGLLNSIISNKVKVQFKGNLKYVVFGLKKEFLIDKTEDIKFKF